MNQKTRRREAQRPARVYRPEHGDRVWEGVDVAEGRASISEWGVVFSFDLWTEQVTCGFRQAGASGAWSHSSGRRELRAGHGVGGGKVWDGRKLPGVRWN